MQKNPIKYFALALIFSLPVFADNHESTLPPQTLFTNVSIFNGTENKRYKNHNVLVENNIIKAISATEMKTNANATVIDGEGKTLMPGQIDSHAHLTHTFAYGGVKGWEAMTWEEIGVYAVGAAKEHLNGQLVIERHPTIK